MESAPKRSRLVAVGRPAVTCLLIVGLYYLLPVEPGVSAAQVALRVSAVVVAGGLITWLIARQISHQVADPGRAPLGGLITALVGGVVFLALADFVTAVSDPGQFVGLETKTDALYFALATLTTVGYGDVHAAGQVARAVVTVQLVFNVVVIATGASVLTRVFGARMRERRGIRPPES